MEKKGTIVHELPPSERNPRNSEGAFLTLKDGRIVFIYSKFIGDSSEDDAKASIAAIYSNDGGRTWTSKEKIIATPDEYNAKNIMSVSLMRMLNGDIGLYYGKRYGWHDTRLHLWRSSDEGETWGKEVCCIPTKGYFVSNNDRVIRTSTGRIIVPGNLHRMRGDDIHDHSSFDYRGIACFFISDDDGFTWREAKNYCVMPLPRSRTGLQETGLIELKNGLIWAWFRTDMGYQYESFSRDFGDTWTMPQPSVFTSPDSPLSMKRIPHNGYLLAVWNPIPNYNTRIAHKDRLWGRKPLVGAISKDDGITWEEPFIIESEEDRGGYCYTAIYFTDDAVLLAYCAGEPEDGVCLARLRIRRIPYSDII